MKLSKGLVKIRGAVTHLIERCPNDDATEDALDIIVEVVKLHPEWEEWNESKKLSRV